MHNELVVAMLARYDSGAHRRTIRADGSWANLTVSHDAAGFIEWRVSLPRGGRWYLHAHMTAAASRPCTLSINGAPQSGLILGEITTSWHSDKLSWLRYGPYEFQRGENIVRIDFSTYQPHLRELGFAPAEPLPLQFPWRKIPDSSAVLSVTPLRDGTIVGVGLDNLLYTRATLTSPWVQVPGSGAVLAVTQLRDGRLLAVATNGLLYTRGSLTSPWVQVPSSGRVLAVRELANRTLLGIGPDHLLYTRTSLDGAWVQLAGSGEVLHIAELSDGTLLGVGTDKQLYVAEREPQPGAAPDENKGAETMSRLQALEHKTTEQGLLIATLEASLSERDLRSAVLEQALAAKDVQLQELQQQHAALHAQLQALVDQIRRLAPSAESTPEPDGTAETAPAEEARAEDDAATAADPETGSEPALPRSGKRFRRGSLWR